MEETKLNYVKIAVRCIFTRPITPNFLIIDLAKEVWEKFLWGDTKTRIEIVKPYLARAHPQIREVSWIPLHYLSNSEKSILIINLLEK